MNKSLYLLILAGTSLASAQPVGVPADQRQQYDDERRANAQRSGYLRQQSAAMQSYRNCQASQQRLKQPNPHNCDQFLNSANYYGKLAASVRIPNRLTGSVTGQPLPPEGSTRGLPGGIVGGTIYGLGTNQTQFNTNPNTISEDPVVDSRDHINNSNGNGAWQSHPITVRRPIYSTAPIRGPVVRPRPAGVNGNGYRTVPPGYYHPGTRK